MFFSPIPVRAQKSVDKYFHSTEHPIERRKNALPLSGTFIANAKSVLSVLGACVKCGDEIELICEGADEKEALETITELINGGLGE